MAHDRLICELKNAFPRTRLLLREKHSLVFIESWLEDKRAIRPFLMTVTFRLGEETRWADPIPMRRTRPHSFYILVRKTERPFDLIIEGLRLF